MKEKLNSNRRRFLGNSVILGAIAAVAPQLLNAESLYTDAVSKGGEAFTFLLWGDSITYGNRTRNNDWIML